MLQSLCGSMDLKKVSVRLCLVDTDSYITYNNYPNKIPKINSNFLAPRICLRTATEMVICVYSKGRYLFSWRICKTSLKLQFCVNFSPSHQKFIKGKLTYIYHARFVCVLFLGIFSILSKMI